MMVNVVGLDHLVLTVRDVEVAARFYGDVLKMSVERFHPADGTTRMALKFGAQKINLHQAGAEFEPKAQAASPGSADLCFVTQDNLADWQAHLAAQAVELLAGLVARTGAKGPITSIYVRDPDGNLIEIASYN